MRVSLVNTVHRESGATTVAALAKLLEQLAPDVVFAEVPKTHEARYEDGSHGNLESLAVSRYGQRHRVSVVSVDLDPPEDEFFRAAQEMFDLIERSSRDYRALFDFHSAAAKEGGLRHLNSGASVQAWIDLDKEVRATIDWLQAPHLHGVYDRWLQVIEARDRAMIANIEEYAAHASESSGVLLVGAAHRKSIIEKVRARDRAAPAAVEWHLELPSELFE